MLSLAVSTPWARLHPIGASIQLQTSFLEGLQGRLTQLYQTGLGGLGQSAGLEDSVIGFGVVIRTPDFVATMLGLKETQMVVIRCGAVAAEFHLQ